MRFSARVGVVAIAVAIGTQGSAVAASLPYLTVGNARHTLEKRFEYNEERYANRTYILDNCYRVSHTHVNCYAEVRASASDCEEELWRVWEVPIRRGHGWFEMATQGQSWGACPEEAG